MQNLEIVDKKTWLWLSIIRMIMIIIAIVINAADATVEEPTLITPSSTDK